MHLIITLLFIVVNLSTTKPSNHSRREGLKVSEKRCKMFRRLNMKALSIRCSPSHCFWRRMRTLKTTLPISLKTSRVVFPQGPVITTSIPSSLFFSCHIIMTSRSIHSKTDCGALGQIGTKKISARTTITLVDSHLVNIFKITLLSKKN